MSSPKTALITGGASGIGKTTAILLASKGYNVVVSDVTVEAGKKVVEEIKASGGKAVFCKLDVVSEVEWAAAVETAVQEFGGLHVLINNGKFSPHSPLLPSHPSISKTAGISGSRVSIENDSLAEYEKVMNITSTSVFLGCKAAAAELRKAGTRGSVVNISSITKNIAIAWAPLGVRCNSVHPGYIDTPMLQGDGATGPSADAVKAVLAGWAAQTPLGRLGRMIEVANVIAFLASDESSFVTGSELVCDGGFTAQ
ncbi:hypothetical protein RQP46_011002 [Phenoliferia psychrophenolica]